MDDSTSNTQQNETPRNKKPNPKALWIKRHPIMTLILAIIILIILIIFIDIVSSPSSDEIRKLHEQDCLAGNETACLFACKDDHNMNACFKGCKNNGLSLCDYICETGNYNKDTPEYNDLLKYIESVPAIERETEGISFEAACKTKVKLLDDYFVPDSNWRDKVTEADTERCVNDIISLQFDYKSIISPNVRDAVRVEVANTYANNFLLVKNEAFPDADVLSMNSGVIKFTKDLEEKIYINSKGKYKCDVEHLAKYNVKDFNGDVQTLPNVFMQFIFKYTNAFSGIDKGDAKIIAACIYILTISQAYDKFRSAGYNLNADVIANSNNNAQNPSSKGADVNINVNDSTPLLDAAAAGDANIVKAPYPTPINNSSDTEKRCDIQTISKEKHLPKWNIEIIDSSVIASMLKDAEKNHLPFLKINASDNLKQKLEIYINKYPSKLHENSQNAFTCEPGKYIRTSSNIGIQLISCNDDEMSVTFLNLISPVDNKARVYTVKTFDYLFEDAPVITKTEETVINGERGAYVAVKYETASDGTGSEHNETDVVHYLFLGDKLRFLTDWNAFHIEESWSHEDDGTTDYSCDAKATLLRLENSEAKPIVR